MSFLCTWKCEKTQMEKGVVLYKSYKIILQNLFPSSSEVKKIFGSDFNLRSSEGQSRILCSADPFSECDPNCFSPMFMTSELEGKQFWRRYIPWNVFASMKERKNQEKRLAAITTHSSSKERHDSNVTSPADTQQMYAVLSVQWNAFNTRQWSLQPEKNHPEEEN